MDIAELQQQGVELRFDRPDRHEFAIRACVGIVEMRAAGKHGRTSFTRPRAKRLVAVDHRAEQRGAFDHGCIDNLALARTARFQQRAHHAEREHHAAAAKVADKIQRRHRRRIASADLVQHAAHRDVVKIVTGRVGQRTVLPPASDAAIH